MTLSPSRCVPPPGLLPQKCYNGAWILHSDNEFAVGIEKVGDRTFTHQLALIDDRHAIADLLHLGDLKYG